MENVFKQHHELWELSFITHYKNLVIFEELLEEKGLAVSSHEIASETVESMPEDLWQVTVFFSYKPAMDVIREDLIHLIQPRSLQITRVEDRDWTSEVLNSLGDIKTDKFHIIRNKTNTDKELIPILLNLTRAFGTGEHATTLGCLREIEMLCDRDLREILDLGTGTGVLAIASKKLWPHANVMATDIDEVAIEVAKSHAKDNEVALEFLVADGVQALGGRKFDLILANILARPLKEMAEEISKILNPEGVLILSGFLDKQAEDVISSYKKFGCKILSSRNHDHWISAVLSR